MCIFRLMENIIRFAHCRRSCRAVISQSRRYLRTTNTSLLTRCMNVWQTYIRPLCFKLKNVKRDYRNHCVGRGLILPFFKRFRKPLFTSHVRLDGFSRHNLVCWKKEWKNSVRNHSSYRRSRLKTRVDTFSRRNKRFMLTYTIRVHVFRFYLRRRVFTDIRSGDSLLR